MRLGHIGLLPLPEIAYKSAMNALEAVSGCYERSDEAGRPVIQG
jgi:hypothetical protein